MSSVFCKSNGKEEWNLIGKNWYYTKYLIWVFVYFVEMIKYYNLRTHASYEMALGDNSKWCAKSGVGLRLVGRHCSPHRKTMEQPAQSGFTIRFGHLESERQGQQAS